MVTEKKVNYQVENSLHTENSIQLNKGSVAILSNRNIGQKPKQNLASLTKMTSINEIGSPREKGPEKSENTLNLPQLPKGGMKSSSNLNKHTSSARLFTRTTNFQSTAREEGTGQGFGISKASMLGTRQSDFFTDLDHEPELLSRFRKSQIEREEKYNGDIQDKSTKVADILNRTKCMGSKTHLKCFTGKQKNILLNARTPDELVQIKELMQAQNQRDLKNLESKSHDLTKELNNIVSNVSKKQKVLQSLEETYERLLKEKQDTEDFEEIDLTAQSRQLEQLESQYSSMQEFETRMVRIIELCDLNKSQNDDWLGQLNHYAENLKKCIADQKKMVKTNLKEARHSEDYLVNLVDRIKDQRVSNDHMLATISQVEAKNREIQSRFCATDDMVKKSVMNMRRNLEESVQERIRQIEENMREEDTAAKNREIKTELDAAKKSMEKYADLFAEGSDGSEWHEKAEMKVLLDNLVERKELEKVLMQKKFDLKDLHLKNNEIKKKINVV